MASEADDEREGRRSSSTPGADHAERRVIVVGYDGWTEPVLAELADEEVHVTALTTDADAAADLRDGGYDVVEAAAVDEASFLKAGVEDADHVIVATLDDHLNVLAVLTVDSVADVPISTFAAEERDVEKLRAAGADAVVSVGQVVAELLVEVAVTDRPLDLVVEEAVEELVGTGA